MSECDLDISDIKNGTKNIQKRKLAKHIQDHIEDEAFDAFMEIFHPNKNIRIPTDEDYITGNKLISQTRPLIGWLIFSALWLLP